MKVNKVLAVCIFLTITGTASVLGIEVKGTAPQFSGSGIYSLAAQQLNTQVDASLQNALQAINDQISGIDDKPEKFMQAWGNAGVFASHGASQRGYAGYKIVGVTTGLAVGIQLPSDIFSIGDELGNLSDKLNRDHDIDLGINPQLFNAEVSLNVSSLLLENLYLGLRFGFMNMDNLFDGFSFSTGMFGVVGRYQLVPEINLGLLQWRGVSVGSGIIYQGTSIGFNMPLDPIYEPLGDITAGSNTYHPQFVMNPDLALELNVNTVTIPLEAVTSVKLLYFLNLSLGLGADVAFGGSELKLGVRSGMDVEGIPSQITETESGKLSLKAGGSMPPSFFNLKMTTGIGLSMGPAALDIPVTIYFLTKGYSIGLTVGVFL